MLLRSWNCTSCCTTARKKSRSTHHKSTDPTPTSLMVLLGFLHSWCKNALYVCWHWMLINSMWSELWNHRRPVCIGRDRMRGYTVKIKACHDRQSCVYMCGEKYMFCIYHEDYLHAWEGQYNMCMHQNKIMRLLRGGRCKKDAYPCTWGMHHIHGFSA